MKINSKKKPPRKQFLNVRLFRTIASILLWAYALFFMRHPDAEVATRLQLFLLYIHITIYIDYMVYKIRYDIFGEIGGAN